MSADMVCSPILLADSDIATLDAALVVLAAGLVGVRASALFAFVLSLCRVEDFSRGGIESAGQVDQLEHVDLPGSAK